MANHNQLGKKGEQLAVDFLIENGYDIVERNYRFNKAEVDIIDQKEDVLAIIEVNVFPSIYSITKYGSPSIPQSKICTIFG